MQLLVRGSARSRAAASAVCRRTALGAALASCALVSGCMTVHVHTADSQFTVLRHFGVLQLQVLPSDKAVVGTLSGVGLAATPMGWSAGYTRQRWAILGAECRAVLWVDTEVDEALRRELAQLAGACLLAPPATAPMQQPTSTRIKETQ